MKPGFLVRVCGGMLGLIVTGTAVVTRGAAEAPALTGVVRSQAEGLMEGVVVIAQRSGSTALTSVTTDEAGRFRFPRTHLRAGSYSVSMRAAGYVLPGDRPIAVEIGSKPATLNLSLDQATTDQVADQMTAVEWWNSMPGTDQQKDGLVRTVVNCGFCHDMTRVMRTRYTADDFMRVIARMGTYAPDNSSACGTKSVVRCDATTSGRVQIQGVARPPESMSPAQRSLAEYLASVNLSGGRTTWAFPLKPLPRPKGRATRAIVTVYPIPRQPSLIHDHTVDQQGNVWYGDSGWGYLGKLEPRTGTFREFKAPQTWPDPPEGRNRLIGVQDVESDLAGKIWAVTGFLGTKMGYFDTSNEQWTSFAVSEPVWAFLPGFHTIAQTNTTWTVGGRPLKALRLNAASGTVDASFPVGADFCYQVARDPQDNMICNDFYGGKIIVVDAKTGRTRSFATPTPNSGPRRGRADGVGNYWFGEFWGDRAGVLDLKTGTLKEFAFSMKYASAYAAAPDGRGDGWVSSTGSDRVMRVNPKTGEKVEYLMPVYYDARKVVVDPSSKAPTVWLANKNLAQLIRIEPLD